MNEIKTEIVDLYHLIQNEVFAGVEAKLQQQTKTVKVSKKTLLNSLEDSITVIEKKHEESIKFWKKTVTMYTDFIAKNPGSQQMKVPDAAPRLPAIVEDVHSYIRLFNSLSEDELVLELLFLREVFQVSAKAISEVTTIRNNYMQAATGSAIFVGNLSTK